MKSNATPSAQEAEVIALQLLGFLAREPGRLTRFMALSGLELQAIRDQAANPAFLGGLLDHVLADQPLLLIFAEEHGLKPERIAQLRQKLPGAARDF